MTTMILQNLIFPKKEGHDIDEMYYHGDLIYDNTSRICFISKGQKCTFDTFYNSLQINVWKKDCSLRSLYFSISGKGKLLVKFKVHELYKSTRKLSELQVILQQDEQTFNLPFWDSCHNGILFVEFEAISDVEIYDANFCSKDDPKRDVTLGLVITHFNRQKFVISAGKRLSSELLTDEKYKNKISLRIIDNSQNLDTTCFDGNIKIIRNINTGGSGGFARGLLSLKEEQFTHCCFMDDDASCETESIKRVYAFFSYCNTNENFGLSGILLYDNNPQIVLEAGGVYKSTKTRPINSGTNTTNKDNLLALANYYNEANYGAWCFFAFTISNAKYMPFPFFVRGDDILFSLQNNFKIITCLGIATWVDNFLNKDNITTRYLSTRSYIAIALILEKEFKPLSIWKSFKGQNNYLAMTYQFDQARGIFEGLKDVMELGPECFSSDLNGNRFRIKLKEINCYEKYERKVNFLPSHMPNTSKEHWCHKIFRKLTINGLLLPKTLFKNRIFQKKAEIVSTKKIYRFKEIYYYNDENDTYYLAKHDKLLIIKTLFNDILAFGIIIKNFQLCAEKFKMRSDFLTSEAFWRDVFYK